MRDFSPSGPLHAGPPLLPTHSGPLPERLGGLAWLPRDCPERTGGMIDVWQDVRCQHALRQDL
jgi:hypothetical protein